MCVYRLSDIYWIYHQLKKPKDKLGGGSREGIKLAIVSANNHYAGFGPETANMFRKMVGLPSIKWQEEDNNNEYKKKYEKLVETNNANTSTVQKSLSDYL